MEAAPIFDQTQITPHFSIFRALICIILIEIIADYINELLLKHVNFYYS